MSFGEKTIKKTNIFDGKVIKLDLHEVLLENGKTAEREIISHPGGVAVIPINEKDEIYFVKQYRKPYDTEVLEIPAGKLERGEEPELCGVRELREETGLTASKVTFITEAYPTPGYTNERLFLYMAEGLTEGESDVDEDEFLNVHKYSLNEAIDMIKSGEIRDAKTIIAILYVKLLKS